MLLISSGAEVTWGQIPNQEQFGIQDQGGDDDDNYDHNDDENGQVICKYRADNDDDHDDNDNDGDDNDDDDDGIISWM